MQRSNSNRNGPRRNDSPRGRNDSSRGRNNSFGNRNNSGPRRNFRQNDGPREEHDAVCDKCHANCTLPFKPTPGKPILCRDCFQKAGGNNSRPRSNFNRPRQSFNDRPKEEHSAVCDKCKKNCTVPFKPTPGKPILCNDCFKQRN